MFGKSCRSNAFTQAEVVRRVKWRDLFGYRCERVSDAVNQSCGKQLPADQLVLNTALSKCVRVSTTVTAGDTSIDPIDRPRRCRLLPADF